MKKIIFIFVLIVFFSRLVLAASELGIIRKAIEAEGQWQRGVILNREVLFTNKNGAVSNIVFDVPQEGDYQLYIYAYQNWRRYIPFIYVEGEDAKGFMHKGYTFFENCWCLDKSSPGRWLMHSPSATPFWHLPQGKSTLKFWVSGKSSMWDMTEVDMEDIVAVETFLLMPVKVNSISPVVMGIIDPEFGLGSWERQPYSNQYGTGIIRSSLVGQISYTELIIPFSGNYLGVVSMYRKGNSGKIEICIQNSKILQKSIIDTQTIPSSLWELFPLCPFWLEKGKYKIEFKNISATSETGGETVIDYFTFIPLF